MIDELIADQGGAVAYGLPSKQTVNAVDGRLQARNVRVGCRLWTLVGERTVQTTVRSVETVQVREVVDVVTDHVTFTVAPDQMLGTPDGWVHARDAAGTVVAWTHARKLCRKRLIIKFHDEAFAARYAACLTAATGLPARLEAVTRPSGYLQRDAPGFRVRVVSSYLADLMRQYVGGDAHHMRQRFPRVVLRDGETFEGFLQGYTDGDGFRSKAWSGRLLVSGNTPFLSELAQVVGARFTPRVKGLASHLVVADSWSSRGTFKPEQHPLQLREYGWVQVHEVRRRTSTNKLLNLYSYRLDPYLGFLVNGHLAREPW
ncbi:hypothetical protein [Streptomyces sp. NPDC093591]|uniref:hypothetical protein n=1 Tax=Streptomyces sp. NPDC093591 TaxID=3366044 RepID=UPI0037F8E88F